MCKIDSKIDAKSYPGGAWGELRGRPEASRRPSGLVFRRNWPCMRKMSDFGTFLGRPGTPLGTLGEPKKSLKIDFLLKNGVPNVFFRRSLCIRLVFTLLARFSVDFSRKIDEKSMKKTMRFFASSLVFFNMATLTKHYILQYESYFFSFRVFAFFPKKRRKKCSKIRTSIFLSKFAKKSFRKPVSGAKLLPNWRQREPKTQKC